MTPIWFDWKLKLVPIRATGTLNCESITLSSAPCNVHRNPSSIRLWNATLSNCRHDTTQPNQDPIKTQSRPTHKTFTAVKKETKSAPYKRMKRLRLAFKFGMRRRAQGKLWGKLCGMNIVVWQEVGVAGKRRIGVRKSRKNWRRIKWGLSKYLVFYW